MSVLVLLVGFYACGGTDPVPPVTPVAPTSGNEVPSPEPTTAPVVVAEPEVAVAPPEVAAEPAPEPAEDPLADPISDRTAQAVGVYLPGAWVRHVGVDGVISFARSAHLNAVVIDVKDGTGRVTYETQIPELRESVVNFLGNGRDIIHALKEAGIYTIARLTCFADPKLPSRMPQRSIIHTVRNTPWVSWGTGATWLDPYNRDNHRMIVAVAREAEAMGFDEIQLDYVRFPVDDGTEFARYPSLDQTPRPQLLIELLRSIDEAVHVPLGVDVFGLTAYREGDPSGLGQDLVAWVDYVDVYTPMLYINSMRNWDVDRPERSRYLVENGVRTLRERVGERPVIRPFLQAFSTGAGHEGFNPTFITRQIIGAREGGSDGFLMWHPGGRYSMFVRTMQNGGGALTPFALRSGRSQETPLPSGASAAP